MCKNDEVASFFVSFGERVRISFIEKLSHFDKAPHILLNKTDKDDLNYSLSIFIRKRSIPAMRTGCENILKATKCRDGIELAFKGHGLSLSDHFWYKKEGEELKYEDINFFTNKWDDTFARAILSNDYELLKKADLNVPDITTAGWGVKGWIYDDGPKLYKLGIDETHSEESIAEVLASKLARRLFNEDGSSHYELKTINGKYASVSPVMINIDEELIPLSTVLPTRLYDLYREKNNDKRLNREFFEELSHYTDINLLEFFVKVACFRSLCFISDLHFDNISIIKNLKTNKVRVAPLYDLGGAFGSTRTGKAFLSKITPASYIVIYFLFSGLEEDWDYSWYDKNCLNGYEDEIREYLSKSDFYDEGLINNIIETYRYQKKSLEELVDKSKQNKKGVAHL